MSVDALTIGRLARAAGVGVETVRFYERMGLIERPVRPQRGFRSYPTATVVQIRLIRTAQMLGFSLREASELLSLRSSAAAEASCVRRRIENKLRDIDDRIVCLEEIRLSLQALLDDCTGDGPIETCPILGALDTLSENRGEASAQLPSAESRRG